MNVGGHRIALWVLEAGTEHQRGQAPVSGWLLVAAAVPRCGVARPGQELLGNPGQRREPLCTR